MKPSRLGKLTPVLLAITVLIGACSSMPRSTSLLDQTRNDFMAAQNNRNVSTYAPLEMKQAGEALELANAAAAHDDSNDKIDKLAYLAKQKIALTQEVAAQKAAEAEIASAGKERDQMRLQQRTNEADQARAQADMANRAAMQAQNQNADAQRQSAEAQRMAAEAQAKAQEANARNAQLEAQLADLAAKKTARGMVITLGDVLFATDQATLSPNGMRTAQKLADILTQNPERSVLVEGFTDNTGSGAHNQDLSERRAMAICMALQQMGIARERVAIRGYGENFPVAANDTMQNRQFNRRVEIVLSDNAGQIPQRQ
jgi:outer membrane protein OmpA-like peptidoglycan-associated protein